MILFRLPACPTHGAVAGCGARHAGNRADAAVVERRPLRYASAMKLATLNTGGRDGTPVVVELVGRDGHTAARFGRVVQPAELYALVDAMPMRAAERWAGRRVEVTAVSPACSQAAVCVESGAGEGIRTLDFNLGNANPVLFQSYARLLHSTLNS